MIWRGGCEVAAAVAQVVKLSKTAGIVFAQLREPRVEMLFHRHHLTSKVSRQKIEALSIGHERCEKAWTCN